MRILTDRVSHTSVLRPLHQCGNGGRCVVAVELLLERGGAGAVGGADRVSAGDPKKKGSPITTEAGKPAGTSRSARCWEET